MEKKIKDLIEKQSELRSLTEGLMEELEGLNGSFADLRTALEEAAFEMDEPTIKLETALEKSRLLGQYALSKKS